MRSAPSGRGPRASAGAASRRGPRVIGGSLDPTPNLLTSFPPPRRPRCERRGRRGRAAARRGGTVRLAPRRHHGPGRAREAEPGRPLLRRPRWRLGGPRRLRRPRPRTRAACGEHRARLGARAAPQPRRHCRDQAQPQGCLHRGLRARPPRDRRGAFDFRTSSPSTPAHEAARTRPPQIPRTRSLVAPFARPPPFSPRFARCRAHGTRRRSPSTTRTPAGRCHGRRRATSRGSAASAPP